MVGRQQTYARKLAERTDSLDGMNRRLNVQLRQMIENMDGTVQAELKRQEEEVAGSRETVICHGHRSDGIHGFAADMVLYGDTPILVMRINRYKKAGRHSPSVGADRS